MPTLAPRLLPLFALFLLAAPASAIEAPQAVFFTEVTSEAVTAYAYTSSGFTGLESGQAGIDFNQDQQGYNDLWHNGNQWSTLASMPAARAGLGAAAVRGRIYAIGGSFSTPVNLNVEYDPVADS